MLTLPKAAKAFDKVDLVLSKSNADGMPAPHGSLADFLKGYLLGIIGHLSDVLQDVQGRKSDESKRKVLQGLAVLVERVGSSISAVAPQVNSTRLAL